MKKFLLPTLCIASITLFSFNNASSKVFELQSDGNYLILDENVIEQQDWDLIKSCSKVYNGSFDFNQYKAQVVITDQQTILIKKDNVPSDPDPKDPSPSPQELMDYLLVKYN